MADAGVVRGLIGPREAPRLWERHLLNCAVIAPAFGDGLRVADVGSGAGLPGLVLAIVRPDLEVTLIEPLLRRTTFLDETVARLGLPNVEVVRARAEELHGRRTFDAVTSRAVAPLDRLLRWCGPLVSPGGAIVALKGSSAQDEIEQCRPVLTRWKASARVETYGEGVVTPPTTVVRVTLNRTPTPLIVDPPACVGPRRFVAGGCSPVPLSHVHVGTPRLRDEISTRKRRYRPKSSAAAVTSAPPGEQLGIASGVDPVRLQRLVDELGTPIQRSPAAIAERAPVLESSNASASLGSTPSRGQGVEVDVERWLRCGDLVGRDAHTSTVCLKPAGARGTSMRARGELLATAMGRRPTRPSTSWRTPGMSCARAPMNEDE